MKSRAAWVVIVPILAFAVWAGMHQYELDRGQKAFARYGCASCHFSGGGPNLSTIVPQYSEKTIEDFIRDPEEVYRRLGRKPLNPGFGIMHRVNASQGDVKAMATYLKNWGK